ncbi:hypothetical protein [Williamsia serinedens]|uniref:Uncharacterized protein n=1 Tax=Williamsia serinedens TaxID=391736 RepID=A0ABT1H6C3_9NOCA|nr:hypothetical protein [Williamsia serinedens]MCP2161407.1 hypothetical protein [Williamsia serinedens]
MTSTAVRSGGTAASDQSLGAKASDLVTAVRRVAAATPGRVVTRYHYRGLTYRELDAALDLMVPVTRGQQMDDRAAVVAAVFAAIPSLSAERDPATVAAVIDGTFARVLTDLAELDIAADSSPQRGVGTSEIDLRGIASRLAGA